MRNLLPLYHLSPWRWSQSVPPKHQYSSSKIHFFIFQKILKLVVKCVLVFLHRIQDIRWSGILRRIDKNFWTPKLEEILLDPPKGVTFETVMAYFMLLATGILICILILVVEIGCRKWWIFIKIVSSHPLIIPSLLVFFLFSSLSHTVMCSMFTVSN